MKDLRSLKIKSGTRVVPYALYGTGFMALVSLLAWANIQSDPYKETKDNAGGIIAGFIVGGAEVGAIVGLVSPKWKGISLPRKKPNATSFYLNPSFEIEKDYHTPNLIVKF